MLLADPFKQGDSIILFSEKLLTMDKLGVDTSQTWGQMHSSKASDDGQGLGTKVALSQEILSERM